jgi:phosphoenolpyruvate-protein kinase (PTS system EI component)
MEAVLQAAPHIVNIRLFDIGGDKLPTWCMSQSERLTSPLAARGVRAFSIFPSAYRAQLQAIANIAQNNRVGLVIPMATDVNDVVMVRQELCTLATKAQRRQISLGVMVETPSAALTVASLVGEANFVRIGPGDLSQFTLAQLRHTISPVNYSGHGFHPSVTNLISQVVRVCSRAEISVSICLDLDPRDGLLKMLHESGIKSLAVAAPALKRILTKGGITA